MKRLRDRQLRWIRALLVVAAVVALACATVGLLLTTDAVDRIGEWMIADGTVLNDTAYQGVLDNQVAWQILTATLALVLILGGLALLALQIPPRRVQQDHFVLGQPEEVPGRNVIRGDAIAAAVEDDIESDGRVQDVKAEVRSDDGLIRLRVTALDDVPLGELHERVIMPAVRRAALVAEMHAEPEVETDVRFAPRASRELV